MCDHIANLTWNRKNTSHLSLLWKKCQIAPTPSYSSIPSYLPMQAGAQRWHYGKKMWPICFWKNPKCENILNQDDRLSQMSSLLFQRMSPRKPLWVPMGAPIRTWKNQTPYFLKCDWYKWSQGVLEISDRKNITFWYRYNYNIRAQRGVSVRNSHFPWMNMKISGMLHLSNHNSRNVI